MISIAFNLRLTIYSIIPIFITNVAKEIGICDFKKINVKSIGHLF
jgi:hypothetical protein